METSAAVPTQTKIVERDIAALSDEDIEHLADLMARTWKKANRMGQLGVVLPMGGCTVVAATNVDLMGAAMGMGFFGIFIGALINTVAAQLHLRGLALEVESLGYDRFAIKQVERAYIQAIRSLLPRFTLRQKQATSKKRLLKMRQDWSWQQR